VTFGDFFNATELSFFTFEQALEDVVSFAKGFSLPANASAAGQVASPDALRPDKTPWILIGADYAGTRAAILRVRNPDV
jgi:hypothetical protein